MDPQQLEAALNADPELVQMWNQLRQAPGMDRFRGYMQMGQAMQSRGLQMPHDYELAIGNDGRMQVKRKSFLERNGWAGPALAMGIPAAAGAGMAAFGGAGGAGGGSTAGAAGSSYIAGDVAKTAGAALGGGEGGGSVLSRIMKALVPTAASAFIGQRAGGGGSVVDPELEGIRNEILGMSRDRLQRQEPIHEAAMALASGMRGTQGHPGIAQAAQAAQAPRQTPQLDPRVAEAITRLMGR